MNSSSTQARLRASRFMRSCSSPSVFITSQVLPSSA